MITNATLDEEERLAILRRYALFDTPSEKAIDELVALAARICETPIALVSLLDADRQWFKSRVGWESAEAPLEFSFCVHALQEEGLFIVPDATRDARFCEHPLVKGAPGIRFYAGVPLVSVEGAALGAFCVIDQVPRQLSAAQADSLEVLGRQVMAHFEARRQIRELAECEQRLRAAEGKLRAIFEVEPGCLKLLESSGTLQEMNAAGLRLIEAESLETMAGQSVLSVVAPEDREVVRTMLKAVSEGERRAMEYRIVGLKGTTRWMETIAVPFRDESTGRSLVVGLSHDITARKLADEKIQRLGRLYAVSSAINEAIVRVRDPGELYERACRIAVEQGELAMAWVGLVEPGSDLLKPMARWGTEESYVDAIQLTVGAEQMAGQGPAGIAFRTGNPSCCNDIAAASSFSSRVEAARCGFKSCAAFPLKCRERSVGILAVYVNETGYFNEEELQVFNALAENLSFAVESRQGEENRRQVETALRASEERFRELAENVGEVFWIRDLRRSQLLYVSPAYEKIWGRDCESLYERVGAWLEAIHPEDRERVKNACENDQLAGVYDQVYRVVRPDGTERWIRDRAFPVKNAAGEVYRVVGTAEDITLRKRVEEALRESETRLASAAEAGRIGIWDWNMITGEVLWSRIHEELWGLKPGSFAGTYEAFACGVHSADFPKLKAVIEEALATGGEYQKEHRVVWPDGSVHWVEGRGAARYDSAGRPVRMSGIVMDISKRKQAEEESRQLATRLTTTLESLTEGFYTLDCDWQITYINREAEKIARRSRTELLGKQFWTLFPEAKGMLIQKEFERAMREKVAVQFEIFYPPFESWFEVRAFPSEQGLAVYSRDVSQERRARESLRVSEERFRLLSKATNDAIWDWDLVSNQQWWNEGLHTLFGFRPEEVAPILDWWTSRIHPEDRERVLKSIHEATRQSGDIWSAEYRFLRKDDQYADVLDRGYVIRDATSQPVRMIGCMTDLSERMRTAERIAEQAALLDKARDAILVRGLDHRILYCNKSAERLYGWSAQEFLGSSVRDLLYADPSVFDRAMREVLEQGEWVGELVQLRKDGRQLTIEGRWTLVRDESGAPKSVLAINTDISERKKLEQQFFRAQRMESIGTLAGGIAHDLNNALAPIVIGLDLLKMRITAERDQDLLAMIGASAQRGADMVRQVLSFARGIEGERVEVDVEKLVREIEKIANETFLKHIHVRAIVADDLWTLSGDPTQLHQVLLNLCVNARDAMPRGGTITIRAENATFDAHYAGMQAAARPGTYVLLQVEDTGTGMASKIIEKIFDPFFTTKQVGQGTGLGLSTSLAIVKSHGGFIRVESGESKGATFKIYLPAQLDKPRELSSQSKAELPRGNGEQILLIDDEAIVREVTKQTLESYGYHVVLARDGIEAIAIFGREFRAISAIVIDMMMPVMDGPETIQVLLKIAPGLPVIAASGLPTSGHFDRAAALGVIHFLSKPYTAEALLTTLKKVLEHERSICAGAAGRMLP